MSSSSTATKISPRSSLHWSSIYISLDLRLYIYDYDAQLQIPIEDLGREGQCRGIQRWRNFSAAWKLIFNETRVVSLGKRPLLSRSGVLCYFENGEKQKRGANLSTNRRVSQCSLICLVAANEIIATGPATVISSGCLLSPKLSRSPSLFAGYPREEERRRGKGRGGEEGRKIERTERLPGGIGRKIAGKLVSRISFWALLADDGRQRPILRRLTTDTSFEPEKSRYGAGREENRWWLDVVNETR